MAGNIITAADLTTALGATPAGLSPGSTTTFRATRTNLQAVVATLNLPQVAQAQGQANAGANQVVPPRVGGIVLSNGVPTVWVGGGIVASTILVQPASAKAYRSEDLSLKMKTEKACTVGLPESRRLPPPGSMDVKDMTSVISLSDWIRGLSASLKECGMDTVFCVTIGGNEIYLLEKWGKATKDIVDTHLANLRILNDRYDLENLTLSGKFLLNSLNDEMLTRTEQELGHTLADSVTGPDVFRAVIALHSMLNDSTERQFVEKLQKLKLSEEPGEDVSEFSSKVLGIAHHIVGLTETGVSDLHTLIYSTFDGSSTPTFATAVSNLLSQCFLNAATPGNRIADWEHQVNMLKLLYRDLKSRNSWNALHHTKEKVEAQGLVGESQIQSLTAEVQRLTRIVGNVGNASHGNGNRTIICHHCGVEGHIAPNCPNKSNGGSTFKLRQPPKDGATHTTTHDGKQYKWCGTCKRWNFGSKAHLTMEHVKKQITAPAVSAPAGQLVLAQSEEAQLGEDNVVGVMGKLTRVAGYHGCIAPSILPIKPEEDAAAAADLAKWLIVNSEGESYCRHCHVLVLNWKAHERTTSHFQTRLLDDMRSHFSSNPFAVLMDSDESEEALGLSLKIEEGSASLCHKTEEVPATMHTTEPVKPAKHLKVLTGQR